MVAAGCVGGAWDTLVACWLGCKHGAGRICIMPWCCLPETATVIILPEHPIMIVSELAENSCELMSASSSQPSSANQI